VLDVVHTVPALFHEADGIIGGAERYAFELARHMADVAPTTLVTFGRDDFQETFGNLRVKVLGNAHFVRRQRTNPISLSLLREVRNANVVHCHQQHILASSIAAAICRLSNRKVFVSDLGGGGWDISAYVSTDNWYHARLHISEYSRALSKRPDDSREHVIWGGVDTLKFSPDATVSQRQGVLFVGRLLPHKGVNYLIEGLPDEMPLSVIGKPYDQNFLTYLHKLATGKNVTFHHNCNDSTLVTAYRTATCIVLPSVYIDVYGGRTQVPELLGQTLLEGMACGLPAICTSVASMPEIVIDGVTGFIVPPGDSRALSEKIAWLRDHPERARIMGQAARDRVLAKFTWPRVVTRCLQIYRS